MNKDEVSLLAEKIFSYLDWRRRGMEIKEAIRIEAIKKGRRRKAEKMSFKDLKENFSKAEADLRKMEPFRRLYLATLFEINGNLDTLALTARVVQENSIRDSHTFERMAAAFERIADVVEQMQADAQPAPAPRGSKVK